MITESAPKGQWIDYVSSLIGISNLTRMSWIDIPRQGLMMSTLHAIADALDLAVTDMAEYLPVSSRTLQRYKPDQVLTKEISDRLLQIAKVYAIATDVFEDKENAVQWLKQKNIALGNIKPLELLDTHAGVEMVLQELGRIRYGVYA